LRKVLRFYKEEQESTSTFEDSYYLAASWGNLILDYIELPRNLELPFQPTKFRDSAGSEFTIEEILFSLNENDEILVLPLSSKDLISDFLYKHERENPFKSKCHVVYNNFARYSFLEASRSLSLDIPNDTLMWLKNLISKYGKKEILSSFDDLKSNIYLLGETIIDEYVYCDALGKVSKDPLVAFNVKGHQRQLGGILAAALHVEKITSKSHVITEICTKDLDFISASIRGNVQTYFTVEEHTSEVIKTRYIDISSNSRVFETYSMHNSNRNADSFKSNLKNIIDSRNLEELIIIDFGHGLIDSEIIELLNSTSINISVNAQSNAGNRGFNPISRYRGATRIFINGAELELEARRKTEKRENLILDIAPNLECGEMYVTQGSAGLLYWTLETGVHRAPGFAPAIIDRVGAGDALLSTVSALRANNIPIEISCLYGNIAGAIAVGSMGNSFSVSKTSLIELAEEILDAAAN
jgi:sugar/nucleoside kinase (ribokinase family)